jgi:hypothetical protein
MIGNLVMNDTGMFGIIEDIRRPYYFVRWFKQEKERFYYFSEAYEMINRYKKYRMENGL